MIDPELLRQLGWSDKLIQAVTDVAESIPVIPFPDVSLPTTDVQSISGTAIFADAVINNTTREFWVEPTARGTEAQDSPA